MESKLIHHRAENNRGWKQEKNEPFSVAAGYAKKKDALFSPVVIAI